MINTYLVNFKEMNAKLNNVELYHMPYKGYPAIINGQDSILG